MRPAAVCSTSDHTSNPPLHPNAPPAGKGRKCGSGCVGLGQRSLGQDCCGFDELCGTGLKCDPTSKKCICDGSELLGCNAGGRFPTLACMHLPVQSLVAQSTRHTAVRSAVRLLQGLGKALHFVSASQCGTCMAIWAVRFIPPPIRSFAGSSAAFSCYGSCVGVGQVPYGQPCCDHSELCGTVGPVCQKRAGDTESVCHCTISEWGWAGSFKWKVVGADSRQVLSATADPHGSVLLLLAALLCLQPHAASHFLPFLCQTLGLARSPMAVLAVRTTSVATKPPSATSALAAPANAPVMRVSKSLSACCHIVFNFAAPAA